MMSHEETGTERMNPGTDTCAGWAERSPSRAVIQAVAAASGRSPVRDDDQDHGEPLEPLYDAVDPDAPDALFASTSCDAPVPGRVEFVYCGYRVSVDGTGRVEVRER